MRPISMPRSVLTLLLSGSLLTATAQTSDPAHFNRHEARCMQQITGDATRPLGTYQKAAAKGTAVLSRVIAEISGTYDTTSAYNPDSTTFTYTGDHGGEYAGISPEYTFKFTTATAYSNVNGSYRPNYKLVQTFDPATDNVKTRLQQQWNGTAWTDLTLARLTYDAAGYMDSIVVTRYNTSSSAWEPYSITHLTRNAAHYVINSRADTWIAATGNYRFSYSFSYTLDAANNTTEEIYAAWDPATLAPKNYTRTVSIYNSGNLNTAFTLFSNPGNNTWQRSDSVSRIYNSAGLETSRYGYQWNSTGNAWDKYSMYELFYTSAGKEQLAYRNQWNAASSAYQRMDSTARTYNAYDQILTYVFTTFDNGPVLDQRKHYNYEQYTTGLPNTVTGTREVQIYPIPASDELRVDLHAGSKGTVAGALLDLSGRTVLQWQDPCSGSYSRTLAVRDIVPGTYLLQLVTPTGAVTRHVTIAR